MKIGASVQGWGLALLLLLAPVPVSAATAADLSGVWNVSVTEALSVKKLGAESGAMATTLEFTPSGAASGTWSYSATGGSQAFAPGGTFALLGGKKLALAFDAEGLSQLQGYLKDWALEWLTSEGRAADGETLAVALQSVVCKPMKIDKRSGAPTSMALKVKGLLTGPVDQVSANRKLTYQAVFAFGARVGLESQLTDAANWRVIATFDQKDTAGTPTYGTAASRGRSTAAAGQVVLSGARLAAKESGNRTYTANGLVSQQLSSLYVDAEHVIVGSRTDGFSHIRVSDLRQPKGKVCNYRGREGADETLRIGLSGFARGTADGRVYAWYGRDIVAVLEKEVVFADAPDYTHNPGPKDRFVSDENGDFWIGACNLAQDGSRYEGDKANGLFRIAADFSGIGTVVADLPVWNIFKDSAGVIWVASRDGIHRRGVGGSPVLVYDSAATGLYPEQIIEHDGAVYAVIKNRFNDISWPNASGTRAFELARWNPGTGQFAKVCDITSFVSDTGRGAQAFVFAGRLYLMLEWGHSLLEFDPAGSRFVEVQLFGEVMGWERIVASGGALYSAGWPHSLCVFNIDGDGGTLHLTPANTAEGLVVDATSKLYSDRSKRMFIGPESTAAFNVFERGEFAIHEIDDWEVAGFFEHKGKTYIQGSSRLFRKDQDGLSEVADFFNNGEKIYYDGGRLWAATNLNSPGFGGIALLDLDTLQVKSTRSIQGSVYWHTGGIWALDRGYQFHDIVAVPHEDSVFIAVGDGHAVLPAPSAPTTPMPYVLKYSYADNTFTRVDLPDAGCEGIRAFATDGKVVYGAARQRLYVYENGAWARFCDLQIGNGFRSMKIANKHLFVISGWTTSGLGAGRTGGMEVVDLRARTTGYYDRTRIPIPADEIYAIEIQGFDNDTFKLWLGGPIGLAYCEFREDG